MDYGYAELQSVESVAVARSPGEEQRHLLAYAPLVKRIVRQLSSQAGGAMDREDMEQIGLMGLLEALRRYGAPDEKFGAFAALRVRGAILDELRRQDWRPRAVRQESHRVRDAVRELTRRLGREPNEAEITAALGLSSEAWQAHQLNENAEVMASFDELLHELANHPADTLSPEAQLVRRRSLEQALGQLNEREQRVIQLYYEYEANFKEIAAVLDLTEARVCQINKGALKKMKAFLESA
ncbi:FliA/WhiG family RNA polymerase sigma factor [Eleftheria terrae]|uniref:FliA/WhiG family RNA polymerase sigma factor n=1 Tax=Eleftheria terrae TaxID=1597781 RepID=UPI00263ADF04|nr:FliA/WhiG family RNA polymerase sigma factor [Eleftheria terrae]WKB54106.1 FliA/WhiG family RNA polymerase sigma factor [Eleftheria terrae]